MHAIFQLIHYCPEKRKAERNHTRYGGFLQRNLHFGQQKEMTFSAIIKHLLFKDYEHEFKENANFYKKLQKNEQFIKDQIDLEGDYGIGNDMEIEDDTREGFLKKKNVSNSSKQLERELEEIWFEVQKTFYLKQCAMELFDNYNPFLKYAQRLAAKFYLIKAEIFYSDPLLKSLSTNKMSGSLKDANIDAKKWIECTKTPENAKYLSKIEEEKMKAHIMYEDTYNEVNGILGDIPIKNFDKGYKPTVSEKIFDYMKLPYRSTTSYIFKHIHENKNINSHVRNKIKMRLFCFHMINRVLNRKEVNENFPFFSK